MSDNIDKAAAWDEIAKKNAEIARLQMAIRWALGEVPDADGNWFGGVEVVSFRGKPAPFGWRSHLRKIAGMQTLRYVKERRTLTDGQQD